MRTSSESTPTKFDTNYHVAVHWLGNNYVLCNNVASTPALSETLEFLFDFDEFEQDYCEIFQWYLTDCSEDDVEFLQAHFGLRFAYCEALDLYVLCVTHFGTSWDYVHWETDLENAKAELGETRR